jgi:hypothetical protein
MSKEGYREMSMLELLLTTTPQSSPAQSPTRRKHMPKEKPASHFETAFDFESIVRVLIIFFVFI